MAYVGLNALLPKAPKGFSARNSPSASTILTPWESFTKKTAEGIPASMLAWYQRGQKPPSSP